MNSLLTRASLFICCCFILVGANAKAQKKPKELIKNAFLTSIELDGLAKEWDQNQFTTDKVSGISYGKDLQLFCDSVKVIYDGVFTVIHRKANDPNLSGIVYTNPKNIINSDNYLRTITSETGYSITGYFDFIFTEQDYLDAKQ